MFAYSIATDIAKTLAADVLLSGLLELQYIYLLVEKI